MNAVISTWRSRRWRCGRVSRARPGGSGGPDVESSPLGIIDSGGKRRELLHIRPRLGGPERHVLLGGPLFGDVVQDVALAFGFVSEKVRQGADHGRRNGEEGVAGDVHHRQLVVGSAGMDGRPGKIAKLLQFKIADSLNPDRSSVPRGGAAAFIKEAGMFQRGVMGGDKDLGEAHGSCPSSVGGTARRTLPAARPYGISLVAAGPPSHAGPASRGVAQEAAAVSGRRRGSGCATDPRTEAPTRCGGPAPRQP